jgi:CRP/FNR family transcriptional regulator
MIYGLDEATRSIYLVVAGKVGTSRIADDGREVLLEIIRPDELFGESAFLDVPRRPERAMALEGTKVMSWAISDIEGLVVRRPRLAVALLQIVAQRNDEFSRRIESFTIDSVERRLARSLLGFSKRFGTLQADGSIRMMPLTHALLSQYVGTSRELITQHMNRFRKRGYVSYSRSGIFLYPDALSTLLARVGTTPAETNGQVRHS